MKIKNCKSVIVNLFILFLLPIANLHCDQIAISGIELSGNTYFSRDRIFSLLDKKPDETYDFDSLDILLRQITNLYLAHSFLFVKVELDEIIYSDDKFVGRIKIFEGDIVRAENIIVRGNDVTRENRLIHESKIQLSRPVTMQAIREAEQRISAKRYIRSANIVPVNNNTLLIDVNEGQMTYISAIFGYVNTNKRDNRFQGFFKAEFLNLMGTDRSFAVDLSNFEHKNTVFLSYHESGVVEIPIMADFRLYREEQDSTYVKTEYGGEIYYDFLSQKLGLSLSNLDIYPGNRIERLVEKQKDISIGLLWAGNFTDDYFNPTAGWILTFKNYNIFVKRTDNSFKRYRVEGSAENFIPVKNRLTLANKISILHLQNKYLNFYDLLKTGGTFSLRGFYEEAYAGNSIIYTNTELRYLLTQYSRFFIFADYGYIEDNRPDFNNKYYDLIGLGLGLRVRTRIGMLRMDYGFHHADGKWMNPMDGIVHFGIETGF